MFESAKKTFCGGMSAILFVTHVAAYEYPGQPHIEPSTAQDIPRDRNYSVTASGAVIPHGESTITVSGWTFVTAPRSA